MISTFKVNPNIYFEKSKKVILKSFRLISQISLQSSQLFQFCKRFQQLLDRQTSGRQQVASIKDYTLQIIGSLLTTLCMGRAKKSRSGRVKFFPLGLVVFVGTFRSLRVKYQYILDRHHAWRSLDPTLDIWSNFVKKKRKEKAFYLLAMSQGFPRVPKGY